MTRSPASLLVVQHDDHLPPGLLGEWAVDRGVELQIVRADREPLPLTDEHDAVVVLGAEASASDLHVPWVRRELAWIAASAPRVPILGIAYGAQALAVALGGRVRRAGTPWVGWGVGVGVAQPPTGPASRLAAAHGSEIPGGAWLSWQHDLVVPPPGAIVQTRGLRGALAYTHGRHVGVQFHPEVQPWLVDWWTDPEHGRPGAPRERLEVLRRLTRDRAASSAASGRGIFDLLLARAGRPAVTTHTQEHR